MKDDASIDLKKIRAIAETALKDPPSSGAVWYPAAALLRDALTPATVLGLLDRLAAAEPPADDGVEIDESWLRSIGFGDDPTDGAFVRLRLTADPYPAYLCLGSDTAADHNGCEAVFTSYGMDKNGKEQLTEEDFVVATGPGVMRTRGAVRRLCHALGIPITPPGDRP